MESGNDNGEQDTGNKQESPTKQEKSDGMIFAVKEPVIIVSRLRVDDLDRDFHRILSLADKISISLTGGKKKSGSVQLQFPHKKDAYNVICKLSGSPFSRRLHAAFPDTQENVLEVARKAIEEDKKAKEEEREREKKAKEEEREREKKAKEEEQEKQRKAREEERQKRELERKEQEKQRIAREKERERERKAKELQREKMLADQRREAEQKRMENEQKAKEAEKKRMEEEKKLLEEGLKTRLLIVDNLPPGSAKAFVKILFPESISVLVHNMPRGSKSSKATLTFKDEVAATNCLRKKNNMMIGNNKDRKLTLHPGPVVETHMPEAQGLMTRTQQDEQDQRSAVLHNLPVGAKEDVVRRIFPNCLQVLMNQIPTGADSCSATLVFKTYEEAMANIRCGQNILLDRFIPGSNTRRTLRLQPLLPFGPSFDTHEHEQSQPPYGMATGNMNTGAMMGGKPDLVSLGFSNQGSLLGEPPPFRAMGSNVQSELQADLVQQAIRKQMEEMLPEELAIKRSEEAARIIYEKLNPQSSEPRRSNQRNVVPELQAPEGKIFVGGLPAPLTDKEFEDFFNKYGSVVHAKIKNDRPNKPGRYGFVTFANPEIAEKLLNKERGFDRVVLKGKTVTIGKAVHQSRQPQQPQIASPEKRSQAKQPERRRAESPNTSKSDVAKLQTEYEQMMVELGRGPQRSMERQISGGPAQMGYSDLAGSKSEEPTIEPTLLEQLKSVLPPVELEAAMADPSAMANLLEATLNSLQDRMRNSDPVEDRELEEKGGWRVISTGRESHDSRESYDKTVQDVNRPVDRFDQNPVRSPPYERPPGHSIASQGVWRPPSPPPVEYAPRQEQEYRGRPISPPTMGRTPLVGGDHRTVPLAGGHLHAPLNRSNSPPRQFDAGPHSHSPMYMETREFPRSLDRQPDFEQPHMYSRLDFKPQEDLGHLEKFPQENFPNIPDRQRLDEQNLLRSPGEPSRGQQRMPTGPLGGEAGFNPLLDVRRPPSPTRLPDDNYLLPPDRHGLPPGTRADPGGAFASPEDRRGQPLHPMQGIDQGFVSSWDQRGPPPQPIPDRQFIPTGSLSPPRPDDRQFVREPSRSPPRTDERHFVRAQSPSPPRTDDRQFVRTQSRSPPRMFLDDLPARGGYFEEASPRQRSRRESRSPPHVVRRDDDHFVDPGERQRTPPRMREDSRDLQGGSRSRSPPHMRRDDQDIIKPRDQRRTPPKRRNPADEGPAQKRMNMGGDRQGQQQMRGRNRPQQQRGNVNRDDREGQQGRKSSPGRGNVNRDDRDRGSQQGRNPPRNQAKQEKLAQLKQLEALKAMLEGMGGR